MRLLLQESSHHAELQSERAHSAELRSLLVAERQTAVNAQQECAVLSERLAEMEKMLSDAENRLHTVLYVMLFLGHFFSIRKNAYAVHAP